MADPISLFAALTFLLAGLVKGVIGLGLPTIAMGLLAVAMPPADAAALLIVPSLVTNVWQMLAGGHLARIVLRLWSMMLGVCVGTVAGGGLLTSASTHLAAAALGAALALYATLGLLSLRWTVRGGAERWLSPVIGAVTGLITAATGVFVIPAVPYLQAIGLDKEELVQALGLSFTVSTLALAQLARVLGVHLQAEGALVDLRGADLDQLHQQRLEPVLLHGALQRQHGLIGGG